MDETIGSDQFPVLVENFDPQLLAGLKVTPVEGFLLSRIDGGTSVADLARICNLNLDVVKKFLARVVEAGAVRFPEEQKARERPKATSAGKPIPGEKPPASLADLRLLYSQLLRKSYHEALGVTKTATADEVRSAFYRCSKLYHPDIHHNQPSEEYQDLIRKIYALIHEAKETLLDSEKRAEYDMMVNEFTPPTGEAKARPTAPAASEKKAEPATGEEPSAQQAIELGRTSLSEGSVKQAREHFERAIKLEPKNPKAYLGLARALLQNPPDFKSAEQNVLRALKLDKEDPEAHLIRGLILKAQGKYSEALKFVKIARAWSTPGEREARKEYDSIQKLIKQESSVIYKLFAKKKPATPPR